MKKILADYLTIIESSPLSKQAKKEQHAKYQAWLQTEYNDFPTYLELKLFLHDLDSINLRYDGHFFLIKVLFPIFEIEIFDHKNLEAIKYVLLNCSAAFASYRNDFQLNLLELGLAVDAQDIDLLNEKLACGDRYYAFTIHEVPWGVLYDMNGASIEQAKDNLASLCDYEQLAKILKVERTQLIDECRFYYTCWIAYLSNQTQYDNFESCIANMTANQLP
jgi:hypothetical protein